MPLEQLLNEALVMGSLFTTMEVFFTAGISYLHQKSPTQVPLPFHQQKNDVLRGHSYPIMFVLGALASPYMQYVKPYVESAVSTLGSYAVFAVGICAVEYACGKLTDTSSGKINFAPWREVYAYLEQRVKEAFPSTKNIPLTLGKKSVFLPLLPAWMAVGAFVDYVHGWMQRTGG